ncbi:MAG: DNA-deoxyinosine glycosylase [Campylobacterota bacterium]
MTPQRHPFEPIIDDRTRVLFLGSFPSIASFEQSFYYAHPRNAFWPIMESIFGVALPSGEAKKAFCLEKGIGLWDVVGSCVRSNSSDTNLKNCLPNDFVALLSRYPDIRAIGCTGKKSFDLFMKYYGDIGIRVIQLPSTSPAHAWMKRGEKERLYREFLEKNGIL